MIKVLVLFGTPEDEDTFFPHFRTTHLPLIEAVPFVEQLSTTRVAGAAMGESPFALIVELEFPSEEAMQEGLNSDPGQAMARDYPAFASGGVTVLFCQGLT
jgi:uncharacterized protein (TIGR02118 family)